MCCCAVLLQALLITLCGCPSTANRNLFSLPNTFKRRLCFCRLFVVVVDGDDAVQKLGYGLLNPSKKLQGKHNVW
jgi:hypothetical protein